MEKIIKKIKNHIKINASIYMSLVFSLALAVIAYLWKPAEEYDLYQYYTWLEKMRNFTQRDLLDFFIVRGEPVIMLYFYIIALIGNFQLLQVLPTFLFYFIAFYIIVDYSKLKGVPKHITLIVTLILLSLYKYISVVSCFRYSLAYMIFFYGIYLDYIKNKNKVFVWFLYIVSCFIHTSVFILLAFRIINIIKNNKIVITILSLIVFILVFLNFITVNISNEKISSITQKIILYFGAEELNFSLQFCFRVCQAIFMIFIIGIYNYINKEGNNFKTNYNRYLYMISIFTFFCIPYYTVFFRFNDFLLICMIPKILEALNCIKQRKEKYIIYVACCFFIIAGIRIQVPVFINMF